MQSGRKKRTVASESLTKKRTAELLGISRSSLYYIPKLPTRDEALKTEILTVLHDHPSYGTRRIAWELGSNRKQVQRVMRKFDLIKPRRRKKRYRNNHSEPTFPVENHLARICPLVPGVVWQTDFTCLIYKGRILYFATVIDRVSREVVGVALSFRHSGTLVREALSDAVLHHDARHLFCVHSDQGSEYLAADTRSFITQLGAIASFSTKGSPWQNGHQESFYSRFKQEMGDLDRFTSLGHLLAEIYRFVGYYNTRRMHSAHKMSPTAYRLTRSQARSMELVSNEMGP
jgi:putative transposase